MGGTRDLKRAIVRYNGKLIVLEKDQFNYGKAFQYIIIKFLTVHFADAPGASTYVETIEGAPNDSSDVCRSYYYDIETLDFIK